MGDGVSRTLPWCLHFDHMPLLLRGEVLVCQKTLNVEIKELPAGVPRAPLRIQLQCSFLFVMRLRRRWRMAPVTPVGDGMEFLASGFGPDLAVEAIWEVLATRWKISLSVSLTLCH